MHPAARPHPALVGLRTGRRQRSFSGDPAGALAAVVRIDLRGVRRGEMRLGRGGDSHPDQISPQGDHPSRLDSLRPYRSGARSFWDRLLGCVLYALLRFRHAVLDRMAQPGNLQCGHHRRPGAGISVGCAPSVRQTSRGPCPPDACWKRLSSVCTVALGIFVFDQTPAGPNTSPALLYTPIPLLIWAALRFGLGGISVSMLIMTFEAIWGTMRGHGPFLAQTPTENATALQLFLLVTATPLMLLAVVIDEERRSKEALRQSANLMGLAAEAGDLAMWVWDVSGNDLWMTERGRSLFGLGPDARLDFAATFDACIPRIAPRVKARSARRSRREANTTWSIACSSRMAGSAGFMGAVVVWGPTTAAAQSCSACRWISRLANRRRRRPRNSGRHWSTSHASPRSAS